MPRETFPSSVTKDKMQNACVTSAINRSKKYQLLRTMNKDINRKFQKNPNDSYTLIIDWSSN